MSLHRAASASHGANPGRSNCAHGMVGPGMMVLLTRYSTSRQARLRGAWAWLTRPGSRSSSRSGAVGPMILMFAPWTSSSFRIRASRQSGHRPACARAREGPASDARTGPRDRRRRTALLAGTPLRQQLGPAPDDRLRPTPSRPGPAGHSRRARPQVPPNAASPPRCNRRPSSSPAPLDLARCAPPEDRPGEPSAPGTQLRSLVDFSA